MRRARCECGSRLDDAAGDLQETQTDAGKLGVAQRIPTRDRGAQVVQQPVGAGVQEEPHLVGERRAAAGAIGRELALVQLDQVLGLAAGAVEAGIEPLGRTGRDVGDDVADVETKPRRLDACGDAAFPLPGLGGMGGLGKAAHETRIKQCRALTFHLGGLVMQSHAGAARPFRDERCCERRALAA